MWLWKHSNDICWIIWRRESFFPSPSLHLTHVTPGSSTLPLKTWLNKIKLHGFCLSASHWALWESKKWVTASSAPGATPGPVSVVLCPYSPAAFHLDPIFSALSWPIYSRPRLNVIAIGLTLPFLASQDRHPYQPPLPPSFLLIKISDVIMY